MPLNFGKWLSSLGYKTDDQPPLVQTVQPVALVADHRMLVSQPRRACGIVGSSQSSTVAVDFPAIQCVTPVPVRARIVVGCSVAGEWRMQVGAIVPLVAPVTLTPQPFGIFEVGDTFQSRWQTGTVLIANGLAATNPSFSTAANPSLVVGELIIPAGVAFTLVGSNAGGGTARFWVEFYELPTDLPR